LIYVKIYLVLWQITYYEEVKAKNTLFYISYDGKFKNKTRSIRYYLHFLINIENIFS